MTTFKRLKFAIHANERVAELVEGAILAEHESVAWRRVNNDILDAIWRESAR